MTKDKPLEVDTDGLQVTASQVIDGADAARQAFEAHSTALSSAAGGLFAHSGRALQAKAEVWRARGADLSEAAGRHGAAMQTAAWRYLADDVANSREVSAAVYRPESDESVDLRL
ncbi:type VII secretion target [Gordonia sp. PKS22-38]|uniref:Type VII secretion target n=1 Tax=Gordonia prachuapensis TaxID=3115651 RepID=A0ABU7N1Y9_9ACTN|nr:type VII secretion target [Gordonia sp. PKS22-38]